jgi:hypothetical protein
MSSNLTLLHPNTYNEHHHRVYAWISGHRNPSMNYASWSKEPNYWTGFLLLHKGPDHLTILHKEATVVANSRGIDFLQSPSPLSNPLSSSLGLANVDDISGAQPNHEPASQLSEPTPSYSKSAQSGHSFSY